MIKLFVYDKAFNAAEAGHPPIEHPEDGAQGWAQLIPGSRPSASVMYSPKVKGWVGPAFHDALNVRDLGEFEITHVNYSEDVVEVS